MKFRLPVIFSLLVLSGCLHRAHQITVSASPGQASQLAAEARTDAQSKAAASIIAAAVANDQNPVGPPQEATAAELSIAKAALPAPSEADTLAALDRVNAALAGDLDTARAAWKTAQSDAEHLRTKVSALEAAAERERLKNEQEIKKLKQALQDAQDEADRARRRMVNWISIGGSALLFIVGVGCFTYLRAVPWLGPKIGLALCASGAGLVVFGVIATWILDHPTISAIIVGAPLLIAAGLAFSNHHHNEEKAS